jgi:hypothetical protein
MRRTGDGGMLAGLELAHDEHELDDDDTMMMKYDDMFEVFGA